MAAIATNLPRHIGRGKPVRNDGQRLGPQSCAAGDFQDRSGRPHLADQSGDVGTGSCDIAIRGCVVLPCVLAVTDSTEQVAAGPITLLAVKVTDGRWIVKSGQHCR